MTVLSASEQEIITSVHLERTVIVDYYYPGIIESGAKLPVLFFNDGQLLEEIDFATIYETFCAENPGTQLLIVGIHAGKERVMEYGTAGIPNFRGQGAKAADYQLFFLQECLLHTLDKFAFADGHQLSVAGFSLGGLSALDMAWNKPELFTNVGVFSGSLWWRNAALDADYDDQVNRIMHNIIRDTEEVQPRLKFYFECGTDDEKYDRNKNGIIDSIDDTQDLIAELKLKGYREREDIHFQLVEGGKHNGETWAQCIPEFLKWGWVK